MLFLQALCHALIPFCLQSPDLYLFNPTCDIAVGNNSISYTPARGLLLFETDTATLPMWLARCDDMVCVPATVDVPFLDLMTQCGISLPRFVTLGEVLGGQESLRRFVPWGWSRATHHAYADVMRLCDASFRALPVALWQPAHRELMSRLTAIALADVLRPLVPEGSPVQLPMSTRIIRSVSQAHDVLEGFSGRVIFKAPWSASGRGLMMCDVPAGRLPDMRWVEGSVRQQGFLTAEPFLNNEIDLSFHFEIHPGGEVEYVGHNFFNTNDKGRFTGCLLAAWPDEVMRRDDAARLRAAVELAAVALRQALAGMAIHRLYSGPLGVDALWYRADDGSCYLHPAIETNIRYTMGRLNISLRQRLHPSAQGHWQMEQFAGNGFGEFCESHLRQSPPVLEAGQLRSGILPMVPWGGSWGAWLVLR
ncbi:hypothetical protein LX69_02747 [Breznakibacter xylanolyticus]|uniref:ATP-grasp domain-containing protein n=1 Tax=Breznakibacter xylanolyticus TaxID=990 RepID=A0A2W7MZC9_9BACT|nr:hypothetical protein LX69_02747 [Breznakibacter xylanolyticus]